MSRIGAVGIEHSPVGTGLARLERTLGHLADACRVDELLLVSAAGRIEAYFAARDPGAAAQALGQALVALVGPDREVARWEGAGAAGRLFRLTAGLDGVGPGAEPVLRALGAAEREGTAGPVLRRLCAEAQRAARRAGQCRVVGAGPERLANLVDRAARRAAAGLDATTAEEGRFEVIDTLADRLEVMVVRVVSPLDTGSLHGRGTGVLLADHSVEVTFLVDQSEFVSLRERMLRGSGDVRFRVPLNDVTAIDATRERPVLAASGR